MKRRTKLIIIAVLSLVVVVALFVFDIMNDAGAFREIEPHFDGQCRAITGVTGTEDIVIDRATKTAFISSADFRALAAGRPGAGGIFSYDLSSDAAPVAVSTDFRGALHPHGLSLYEGSDGERRLFVVNHPTGEESTVEIFTILSPRELRHVRTVAGGDIVSLNDVAAVGPEQFYATNDAGTGPSDLLRPLETFLRLPWASVVYFDGRSARRVVDGLRYANGVVVTRSGQFVYVAETTGRAVRVYERDIESGGLTWRSTLPIPSGLDNLSFDDSGRLWLAAHPKMLDFLAHAGDASALSPSQVFIVRPFVTGTMTEANAYEEIYLESGEEISGSSVAVPVSDSRFLIGSVFEPHFLDCVRGSEGAR
jgi:arylesterase / paraoxonase